MDDVFDVTLTVQSFPLPDEIDGIPVWFGEVVRNPMFWLKDDLGGAASWPDPRPSYDLDADV